LVGQGGQRCQSRVGSNYPSPATSPAPSGLRESRQASLHGSRVTFRGVPLLCVARNIRRQQLAVSSRGLTARLTGDRGLHFRGLEQTRPSPGCTPWEKLHLDFTFVILSPVACS
ncbi:hypothetical protein CSUI_009589, partial [Cystoisospora suis]